MRENKLINLSNAIEECYISNVKHCLSELTDSDRGYILDILKKEIDMKASNLYDSLDYQNDYGLILNTLVCLEYSKEMSDCLNKNFKEFLNLILDINTLNFIERFEDIFNMKVIINQNAFNNNIYKSMISPQVKIMINSINNIDFMHSSLSDDHLKKFRDVVKKNNDILNSIGYYDILENLSNKTLGIKIINDVLSELDMNKKRDNNKRKI